MLLNFTALYLTKTTIQKIKFEKVKSKKKTSDFNIVFYSIKDSLR